jgi:cadherin 5 type 2 (VE-cadherin)
MALKGVILVPPGEVAMKIAWHMCGSEHLSPHFSFLQPLDYELIRQYMFTIEATDPTINLRYLSGISGKNKARVIINVTDVDEPPVFQQDFYHFRLQENKKPPLIGSVQARDPDETRHNIG